VINVTGSEAFESLFLGRKPNFQKDALRSGMADKNIPGTERDTIMWQSVCIVLNATLTVVIASDNKELNKLYYDSSVDVLHQLRTVELSLECRTHPIQTESLILVVPEALPYPEFTAYLKTVMSDNFFVYSFITIVLVICLLTAFRWIKQKRFLLFQCAADVLNLLMNDDGDIKYRNLPRVEVFVILPLTFAGFIIVNGILSTLQSYVTRPVLQPQINTIEDVYNSPFPILTPDEGNWYNTTIDSLTFLLNRSDWSDRVHAMSASARRREGTQLNNSVIFVQWSESAKFALDAHKRKNIKVYRIPNQFNPLKICN